MNSVLNEGGALGPAAREASIARLRATSEPGNELDILIVGGGIVGTGAALDAVTRGLSVGIVEASDWAAGTYSDDLPGAMRRSCGPVFT